MLPAVPCQYQHASTNGTSESLLVPYWYYFERSPLDLNGHWMGCCMQSNNEAGTAPKTRKPHHAQKNALFVVAKPPANQPLNLCLRRPYTALYQRDGRNKNDTHILITVNSVALFVLDCRSKPAYLLILSTTSFQSVNRKDRPEEHRNPDYLRPPQKNNTSS